MSRLIAILKRPIAVLGMLVALASSFQDARLFCQFGCCGDYANAIAKAGQAQIEACGCCNGIALDTAIRTRRTPTPRQSDEQSPAPNSCPRPNDCWCDHPPSPLELPRTSNDSVGSQFQNGTHVVLIDSVANQTPRVTPYAAHRELGANLETAVARCAELCRFLI